MGKRVIGFGSFADDDPDVPEMVDTNNVLELVRSASDEQLLIIQDVIREKLESDTRLSKIPDLANPEFSVFDNRKIEKITPKILDIRRRRYSVFVYYYSHFDRTDDQMVQFIQMCNPELSYIEAVRDLSNIKLVIGNLPRARKELIRYQVTEMHRKAYQKAIEKNDPLAMTTAANNISKANALDKEDIEIPWDQMIPPAFEPTSDISVLERDRIPEKELDEKIKKLKAKYDPDIQEAEEVE